jgi:WD40 repeat protein
VVDVATGAVAVSFAEPSPPNPSSPRWFSWAPASDRLITSDDTTTSVWGMDGARIHQLRGGGAVTFHPDSNRYVRGDRALHWHDAATGAPLSQLGAPLEAPARLAWSNDGATLLVANDTGRTLDRWDVAAGRHVDTVSWPFAGRDGNPPPLDVVVSPSGRLASLRQLDNADTPTLQIWDLEKNVLFTTVPIERQQFSGPLWSPDEQELVMESVTTTGAKALVRWSLKDNARVQRVEVPPPTSGFHHVDVAGYTADGESVVVLKMTSGRDARHAFGLWARTSSALDFTDVNGLSGVYESRHMAPGAPWVAMVDTKGQTNVWSWAPTNKAVRLPEHNVSRSQVRLSADARLLAEQSMTGTLTLWHTGLDGTAPRAAWTLQDAGMTKALTFSHDGKRLALGFEDHVRVFDLPTGRSRTLWRLRDGWVVQDSEGAWACGGVGCAQVRFRGRDRTVITPDAPVVRRLKGLKRW